MSIPIAMCRFRRALTDDVVMKDLAKDLCHNLDLGHFLILGCKHNPPCRPLTEEEWNLLTEKMELGGANENKAV